MGVNVNLGVERHQRGVIPSNPPDKSSIGGNEKILSSLQDFENQGQAPFVVTFLIYGCKHDTNSILVSILTFERSRISTMLKLWPWN